MLGRVLGSLSDPSSSESSSPSVDSFANGVILPVPAHYIISCPSSAKSREKGGRVRDTNQEFTLGFIWHSSIGS